MPRLHDLLQQLNDVGDDGSTVEAKRARSDLPSIQATLSAFANTAGGFVLLGVSQREVTFVVTGVDDPSRRQRQLADACKRMSPPVRAAIDVEVHEDGPVVIAWIPRVDRRLRPCHAAGKPAHGNSYLRSGDQNLHMSDEEVTSLLLARQNRDLSAEGVGRSVELDPSTTRGMVERERAMLTSGTALDDEAVAARLRLMGDDGTPTIAAVLLAGPTAVASGCGGRVVIDLGRRRPGGKSQGENAEGTLPEVLARVLTVVQEAVGTEEVVDDRGSVREVSQVNALVLREVVANALLHRSYDSTSCAKPVRVDVRPALVRVTSPGPFVPDLEPSLLGLRTNSRPRNPHLMFLAERTTTPDGANLAEFRSGGYPDADSVSRREQRLPPVVQERPDEVVVSLVRRRLLEPTDATSDILVAAAARLGELDLELDSSLAARILGVPRPEEARPRLDQLAREGRLVRHRSPAAPRWTAAPVHGRVRMPPPELEDAGPTPVVEFSNLDRVLAALWSSSPEGGWTTRAVLQEATGLGRETLLTALRDGIERGAIQARGAANSPKRDYRMSPGWRDAAPADS